MSIKAPTTERDKRDKKLRADKSSLKATKNKNIGISAKTKKSRNEKAEKPVIPITKLRTIYGILYEEIYPETEEDEKKERKQLISAIKKKLK